MRIAYLLHLSETRSGGVYKKVKSQILAWKRAGHEPAVFLLTSDPRTVEAFCEDAASIPVQASFCQSNTGVVGYARRLRPISALAEGILRWRPDLVYYRHDIWYSAVEQLACQLPTVVEVQTNDIAEYKLGSYKRYWYHRATRSRLFRAAKGLIFVTKELAQLPQYADYGKPSAVIPNGIALDDYAICQPSSSPNRRLVFVGSPKQAWHGVDKILWLAGANQDWRFDLIGLESDDSTRPLSPNVTAHGQMEQQAYASIVAQADVALGTLALHRKGMDEASPLKTREYLAYGLPVIIGYKDADFPESTPYLLQLSNAEDNVRTRLEDIRAFVALWQGRRVPRSHVAHLDYAAKEGRRLAFFEQIAGGRC